LIAVSRLGRQRVEQKTMTEYEFTLKFTLPDPDADPELHVAALERSGCDDAIIGIGKRGRIALEFARRARSSDAAVRSALADVRKVIPGARLVEAQPDLVGLSDVADVAGCTRQNLRKLSMSDATFPTAVHEGNPSLFHLVEILQWIRRSDRADVPGAMLDIAETNRQLNIAVQVDRLPPRRELFAELCAGATGR
jgi:hypothetical protein